MSREFRTVGVVGLGTMGAGIAEVFARGGFRVVAVEQSDDLVETGRRHLRQSTERAVRRGRMTDEQQHALLDRITTSTALDDLEGCDLVVEAVVERLDVKQAIFGRLDAVVAADAVLATNTSSLSVTAIASSSVHPERVVGLHFFNPAPVQTYVEVVGTVVSQPSVVTAVERLVRDLGKSPVVVGDRSGFVANALLFGYLNAAVRMLESGHASRDDIDAALRLGCGFPMGPLQLLDLVGLDTALQILDTMYREGRSARHAAAPLLRRLVTAGLVGRKSARGFYVYGPREDARPDGSHQPDGSGEAVPETIRVGVVGTGALAAATADLLRSPSVDVASVPRDGDQDFLASSDLVVDATGGDLTASSDLFRRLGRVCRDDCVLASASSELAVAPLAAASGRPGDALGLRPVSLNGATGVVEIVSTRATTERARQSASAVCAAADVQAVHCSDRPGRVVDALVYPYLNDAVAMLESGYATVVEIDAAMRDGCALPAGPFEMLDAIGADSALAVLRALHAGGHDPSLAPAALLEQVVSLGHTAGQTGRGGFRDLPGA
jgi:3-hydroxybutyryl-CoA dehydrogenase